MNTIKKMVSFIKSIFIKKEEIKMIEAPVETSYQRKNFTDSLKVVIPKKIRRQKLETPICVGDGLGIKKMSY